MIANIFKQPMIVPTTYDTCPRRYKTNPNQKPTVLFTAYVRPTLACWLDDIVYENLQFTFPSFL